MRLITRRELCRCAMTAPTLAGLLGYATRESADRKATRVPQVNYMLRYVVKTESAQQQTAALIAYCRQHHVRHVILFSDNNWDTGWNLPTLEEAGARVEVLRPVVRQLRRSGLHVSINMMTTIGHGDFGRDERTRFPWQFMVGDDGEESHTAPCPLDPKWRDYIARLYSLYATLAPEIMFIDDDFRYHNHGPLTWGCFCPLHLREMARRTEKDLGREELLRRILTAQPQPTPERQEWLKLCGDSMLDVTRLIAEAVKTASPETRMGLMCGAPDVHAAEGWRWNDMIHALSVSSKQPVLRPSYASYSDVAYRDVAADLTSMRKLQACLPNKVRFAPELETFPFTEFSKSAQLTCLQIALSAFLVPPDITLDIHAFAETQLDDAPTHTRVLNDSFDYFNGLVVWATQCRKERGLQVLWDNRLPLHRAADAPRMSNLPAPPCWEGTMDLLGFATTFYPDEVKLIGRSYLEERSGDELRSLLKAKLLMDGDAAQFLVDHGFGEQVGLKGCEPIGGANCERLVDRRFAGRFFNHNLGCVFSIKYQLDPREGAILVSKLLGPAASFSAPGMTLFENAGGGRIGIVPFSGSHGDLSSLEFRNWKRQYVLKKMLEWINRGPLPLFVEGAANVLPLRRDGETAILIGIANLSADPIPRVAIQLGLPLEAKPAVEYLSPDGRLQTIPIAAERTDGCWRLRIPVSVSPLSLACFRLVRPVPAGPVTRLRRYGSRVPGRKARWRNRTAGGHQASARRCGPAGVP